MMTSRGKTMTMVMTIALVIVLSLATSGDAKRVVATDEIAGVLPAMFGRLLGTVGDGIGGGSVCVGCTAVVALVEQYSQIHNKSVEDALDDFCKFLPKPSDQPCIDFVDLYGADIIVLLDNKETPDRVCRDIKLCTLPTCNLFPEPSAPSWGKRVYHPSIRHIQWQKDNNRDRPHNQYSGPYDLNPWQWIMDEINRVFNSHLPFVDDDNDTFSTILGLRGSAFRGKDCDDMNAKIYPGRSETVYPANVDHNCNGIYGTNNQGQSYEDLLCSGTQPMGFAILGDSAGAHFHVPPSWVTATELNSDTFKDLIQIAENEIDWPFMSAATGYMVSNWSGAPVGKVSSTYMHYFDNNRCNHRDYQSICVNGARSTAMADTIMYSFRRNQQEDNPVLLTYALIGNDVCNPHYGLGHMTTPEEFYASVTKAMEYLDTVLPLGSHVVFMGLVDGRILYDSMHARIHPIGAYRGDVTYAQFYDFFNCLEVSPCFGWMNSNATWRNLTSERAFELNKVYGDIIQNNTYKHFDMTYFDCPLSAVVSYWEEQGGEAWELIEPVDGFHPNQIANYLTADYQWNFTTSTYPYLVPPANPNNEQIKALFGDQGGY
eukprot:TRINITY_DN1696_c0_g1_i1.p1 TRINITY_DN1696_c0_g1~~TRINITY_DN1696_c0_g1_i1.p1  ORF type:complete len:637 (+),score=144.82 TRINITY_DN1696_c0_g1_i1:113-1912(+)